MPPDLALLSTLVVSNYPCLELIFMVSKEFEPSKFDGSFCRVLCYVCILQKIERLINLCTLNIGLPLRKSKPAQS